MIDPYEILEQSEKREKLFSYDDLKKDLARITKESGRSVSEVFLRALQNAATRETELEEKEESTPEQKSNFSALMEIKRSAESSGLLRHPNFKYDFDVFISHRSTDIELAKKVYVKLVELGLRPFLSELEIAELHSTDYATTLSEVLANVQNMVVVGSSCKNIDSGWVRFEWNAFANESLSGRKRGNLITILSSGANCDRDEIPFLLRQFEILAEADLERLESFMIK